MSIQLQSLQRILHSLGMDAYLRTQSAERTMATLGIEIETGPQESNLLEVCEILVPDSDLFLLQWFVQLPLSAPFAPSDPIPEFQIAEVLTFCAELNQILPIGIFNVFDERLCFRHIFTCEFLSQAQVEYLVQTIEGCIQRVQPKLQEVAIGTLSAQEAIASIDALFSAGTEEDVDTFSDTPSMELSAPSHHTPPLSEQLDSTLDENPTDTPQAFSIDDLSSFSLNIETVKDDDTQQTEGEAAHWSDDPIQDDWDDSWDIDALENDVMVFEDETSEE